MKRLPRRRIEELPLLQLEALELKLSLLREDLALRRGVGIARQRIGGWAVPPHPVALNLLLLELLLLETLP